MDDIPGLLQGDALAAIPGLRFSLKATLVFGFHVANPSGRILA